MQFARKILAFLFFVCSVFAPALQAQKNVEAVAVPVVVSVSGNVLAAVVPPTDFSQVTASGAIENTTQFKKAAYQAWCIAGSGLKPHTEAGFTVTRDGNTTSVDENVSEGTLQIRGHLAQTVDSNTVALVHTHPLGGTQPPSTNDVAVAQHLRKPVYVINRSGLFVVVPGSGQIVQLFVGLDWMSVKKTK